jgi:argininosuccinate lyase
MTWHPAYRDWVLAPDYAFAERHLTDLFLDTLVAHARGVAALPLAQPHADELAALEAGLQRLRTTALPPRPDACPDLYFALQRALEADVGSAPLGWLRLGLSRNDLDMTVYVLRARDTALRRLGALLALHGALLDLAEEHVETVMIASTHHQPGQPTTVGHYLAAMAAAIERDVERALQALERLDRCPLGAAALAGTSHPLDREASARRLGFRASVASTYDAVSAADWQVDVAHVAQSVALTLSRLLTDLIAWASAGVLRLDDGLVQGSSIMPQKRNPVALEHARTRCSRTLGVAQAVALPGHNIPFGDLNDFGPDAQGALQSLHQLLLGALELTTACLRGCSVDIAALARSVAATDTTATELADELVRTGGRTFPEAHRDVAALLAHMAREGRPLGQAEPADLLAAGGPPLDPVVLRESLAPHAFVARRSGLGGPAPVAVRVHLRALRERAGRYHGAVDGMTARIDTARQQLRGSGKDD